MSFPQNEEHPRQSLAALVESEYADGIIAPKQNPSKRRIRSTPWSTSFECDFIDANNGIFTEEDLKLLAHLNCSYLSSGKPPTLLSLKQHAQSLAILIRKISVSTSQVFIDCGKDDAHFVENEAFDWLADLSKPYENIDEYHSLPLQAVQNQITSESEVTGPIHHCPLNVRKNMGGRPEFPAEPPPYESAHGLLMHANECLELLDDEFNQTGGLLSILPTDDRNDSEQLACARNTLVGQWLIHHQRLVSRTHELECDLVNTTDLLANTSIPRQLKHDDPQQFVHSAQPQDRYILTNAGDDVTNLIHTLLDKREAEVQRYEKLWKDHGVSGGRLQDRGLVQVDVISRVSRLKGHGNKSPIFLLPCSELHPGVKLTRALERKTPEIRLVVQKPGASLERRRAWEIERAAACERELQTLRGEHAQLRRSYDRIQLELVELTNLVYRRPPGETTSTRARTGDNWMTP